MKFIITPEVGLWAANRLQEALSADKNLKTIKPFVLALPTGATSIDMYRHMTAKHKAGALNFENIITFNLDEYVGLPKNSPGNYYHFMCEHLFNHVNIKKSNINFLNGMTPDTREECLDYEEKIRIAGGIDLLFAGVGVNGHIAFNEPGSQKNGKTAVVTLAEETLNANARFFLSKEAVPKKALTMGMGTILAAKEIIVLATGESKAVALQHAITPPEDAAWPVSLLQSHPNVTIVADEAAVKQIKEQNLERYLTAE